jgi:hypothetical protein
MKIPTPGNRTTMALLVLCALMLPIVLAQVALYDPVFLPTDADKANVSLDLPENREPLFRPRQFADFSEVLERPLMFAARRMPPEPEAAPIRAAPKTPLRLGLEGVAISADSRVALLRNTVNNQLLQLAEGMSHDGWTLETIRSSGATFRRGDEAADLLLDANAK